MPNRQNTQQNKEKKGKQSPNKIDLLSEQMKRFLYCSCMFEVSKGICVSKIAPNNKYEYVDHKHDCNSKNNFLGSVC